MSNLGLFGGRFDPVHHGHLRAARIALGQFALERVVFIPMSAAGSARPPIAPAEDRVAVLRRALQGEPFFAVSDFEVRQPGRSFTVDTVLHFARQYADSRLFWIMGSDHLGGLAGWRGIDLLARTVEFVVIPRADHPIECPGVPGLRLHVCPSAPARISSSELRTRAHHGQPLDDLMPPPAAEEMLARQLYR